jgi:hypothetical protein
MTASTSTPSGELRKAIASGSFQPSPPGRAEAVVGEDLLEQQVERAAVDVALGDGGRVGAAERIELEREELDVRVHADRVEEPARDRAEESLQEFRVGQRLDALRIVGLDLGPERGVVRGVTELQAQLGDRAVDRGGIELEPGYDVGLAAGPVPALEALRRAPRDRPELGVVPREGRDDRGRAFRGARVAQRMLRIKASPNSLVFTSFAPSISRAKS